MRPNIGWPPQRGRLFQRQRISNVVVEHRRGRLIYVKPVPVSRGKVWNAVAWAAAIPSRAWTSMVDPFLNYFALGLLFFVVIVLFYGIIAIHDIPAKIAHARHHPHQDAIHAAGWVSLFMLHALWPFLWIWAMAYQPERGWGLKPGEPAPSAEAAAELEALKRRLAEIEGRIGIGAP
jgi:hypothetical protein